MNVNIVLIVQLCTALTISGQYVQNRYPNNGNNNNHGSSSQQRPKYQESNQIYQQHADYSHENDTSVAVHNSDHPQYSDKSDNKEIVIVLLMSNQKELPIFFEIVKPTVELAVEKISAKYPHLKFRVKSRKDDNSCESNVLGAIAAEEYYVNKVSAFIGPICGRALDDVARLATYWQIPIITAGGMGAEFSNKNVYKSLTRVAFSLGMFGLH